MPQRIGRGGRTGQTHTASPRLRSYETPPASDVTVIRPDGTRETLPAQKPKPTPGKARRPKRRGPAICAMCGYPIEGKPQQGRDHATRGKPVHPAGACTKPQPKKPTKPDPASTLPRTRGGSGNPYKSPNTRAVGKDLWSKVTCPRCKAAPGKLCTVVSRAGTVQLSKIPHQERIQVVRRALAAVQRQQGDASAQ